MVRRAIKTVGVALFVVLVAPFAGQAKVIKPPIGTLNQRMPLVCSIYNHMLTVGSAYALRRGTQIYFTAKLAPMLGQFRCPVTFPPISR